MRYNNKVKIQGEYPDWPYEAEEHLERRKIRREIVASAVVGTAFALALAYGTVKIVDFIHDSIYSKSRIEEQVTGRI